MVNETDIKEIQKLLSELEVSLSNINDRLNKIINETKIIELCPICGKPLHGSGKTLTSREDEKVVHLSCYISHPCDCPHEMAGCHYSGYCEHRRAPDKDLNGTYLPTYGVKFPGKESD